MTYFDGQVSPTVPKKVLSEVVLYFIFFVGSTLQFISNAVVVVVVDGFSEAAVFNSWSIHRYSERFRQINSIRRFCSKIHGINDADFFLHSMLKLKQRDR
uniref:Uncharacterized protein n=1 Tax=Sipha flava TaxID=143950 RepID=A0A2S2QIM9_9HEMI